MNEMLISDALKDWAALADYTFSAGSKDGAGDMFWNRGGEIRFFLRMRPDGWTSVTCSDRMGPEYFYFCGSTAHVVEYFFYDLFGQTYRFNRGLPLLNTPVSPEELADGYRIEVRQFEGADRFALIDPENIAVAVASGGRISATAHLAPLSIFLNISPTVIMDSFKGETGQPLFKVLD